MNTIPQDQWEWYGNAGHFIFGRWCRFHLTTLVGQYIVSTVGEYVHPRHSGGSELSEREWLAENWPGEDIGCGRKFETMVFRWNNERCATGECNCGLPQMDGKQIEMHAYNDHKSAREGHMAMCHRYASEQP